LLAGLAVLGSSVMAQRPPPPTLTIWLSRASAAMSPLMVAVARRLVRLHLGHRQLDRAVPDLQPARR
jgi:hypothetical protein